MNKYLKGFFHRGLIFGGFGPIIMAIVYLVLSLTLKDFSVSGAEMFSAIISTYLLAFIHAGASVFNQIESWGLAKSLFFHFFTLYLAYSACYLINTWIPFDLNVFLIFTAIFIAVYFVVWLTVMISVKALCKKMNGSLK
ncbi:MAG: DUF3021 domain-containing protein [Clostridia bacterium]|nr:DUF3021 domain-containing protein [Clostridia bacterium]